MPSMVMVKCKNCRQQFSARIADRNRGWARFCSKSCKAKKQEARTGQYARYRYADNKPQDYKRYEDDMHPHDPYSLGQD